MPNDDFSCILCLIPSVHWDIAPSREGAMLPQKKILTHTTIGTFEDIMLSE